MKLTKALSLILTVAMLFGTLALGVTAAVDDYDTVLYPGLYTTGVNGYQAVTPDEIPLTAIPMTAAYEAGYESIAEDAVYTIEDGDELKMFSKLVNAGADFFMAKIYLKNNIDMTNITMDPIANYTGLIDSNITYCFRGDFNGRGFTISNLKMTSAADKNANVALFGCLAGGVVQNLIIDSTCSFTYTGPSKTARTAAVVAYAMSIPKNGFGAATDTTWNEEGPEGANYAVGSYGQNKENPVAYLIKNVKSEATVSASSGYTGGILGWADGNTSHIGVIIGCTQTGNITSGDYAAGILGAMNGNSTGRTINIVDCQVTNTANISGYYLEATANIVNGKVNIVGGDFSGAVLVGDSFEFDTTVRGYSYYNMKIVSRATEFPRMKDYDTNNTAKEFKIADGEDLVKLAELVDGGNQLKGVKIYVVDNIDMTGLEMTPIGADPSVTAITDAWDSANSHVIYFAGVFDGQGYTIDNLKMDLTQEANGMFGGLFANVRNATIQNVVLGSGCEFTSSAPYVASLVGRIIAWGGEPVHVVNCYSAAKITNTSATGCAAGLVGAFHGSTNAPTQMYVSNCTNAGAVTGAKYPAAFVSHALRAMGVNYNVNMGVITSTSTEKPALVGYANVKDPMTTIKYNVCIYDSAFVGGGNASGDGNIYPRSIESGECSTKEISGVTFEDDLAVYNKFTTNATYVGAQMSEDGTSVRLLAVVNSLDAFKVGFAIAAETTDDLYDTYNFTTETVYGSILADGQVVTAESLGGKHIVVVTITGIPANATALLVNGLTQMTDGGALVADSTEPNVVVLNANA